MSSTVSSMSNPLSHRNASGEKPFQSEDVELGGPTQLGIESMHRTPRTMSAYNRDFPRALRHPR
jgi:hypothetical protein